MHLLSVSLLLCCLSLGAFGLPAHHLEGKDAGSIWALLVAGSNTWDNYRHQADVCHAYQVLHDHGVPDDHIVVMMYDDIADNTNNPKKGNVINKIGGPNVYTNVPKDYTKTDVTPENFLKIMQGEKPGVGSGKVIASGPNDYVFINFVDHGAPNIVAFPNGELTSKQLNNAITSMSSKQQFKQMVLYIEACESGSMFDKLLPANINVYATTASNPTESSYACYYDSKLGTYLGDVYSVNWMENVDSAGTATETLEDQYKVVQKETNTSHVMQYGELTLSSELLEIFMGSTNNASDKQSPQSPSREIHDAVPSGDVRLGILSHKIFESTTYWEKKKYEQQLIEELMLREKIRLTMEGIVLTASKNMDILEKVMSTKATPTDMDCYTAALRRFSDKCFRVGQTEFALRVVYALANLCDSGVAMYSVLEAIDKNCP